MPRESAFSRLLRHFATHPKGRLHEMLFWLGLGTLVGGGAFLAWRLGGLSTPLALMAAIIALCLAGWAFLPQGKARAPPPLPPGKRGQIAKQIRANKKPKQAPPPGPPIRRG